MSAWDLVFWGVLVTAIVALLDGLMEPRPRDEIDALAERRAREWSGRDAL